MKICPRCRVEKPLSGFQKNRATPDGLQYHCTACRREIDCRPEKRAADRARYHTPEGKYRWKDRDYKNKYGLGLADVARMLKEQNHGCAICAVSAPGGKGNWHVDHCHNSGRVRGLLCCNCNVMLGMSKDNPLRLEQGAAYLRKFA